MAVVSMMDKWPAHSRFATTLLVALLALIGVEFGIVAAAGTEPSEMFWFISFVTWFAIVLYWFERDGRQRGLLRVWDRGWFLCLGWWVVLPYYLIKTRGLRKGLMTCVAWPAVSLLVTAAAVAIGFFVNG